MSLRSGSAGAWHSGSISAWCLESVHSLATRFFLLTATRSRSVADRRVDVTSQHALRHVIEVVLLTDRHVDTDVHATLNEIHSAYPDATCFKLEDTPAEIPTHTRGRGRVRVLAKLQQGVTHLVADARHTALFAAHLKASRSVRRSLPPRRRSALVSRRRRRPCGDVQVRTAAKAHAGARSGHLQLPARPRGSQMFRGPACWRSSQLVSL